MYKGYNRITVLKSYFKESKDNYYMNKGMKNIVDNIKDSEEIMEWCTPWKPGFRFIINRYENRYTGNYGYPKYTIELKILDTFYNLITIAKMSEVDLMQFIDQIEAFINEMEHQEYSSVCCQLRSTSTGVGGFIELTRHVSLAYTEDGEINPSYYDKEHDDLRDIKFTLYSYNMTYGNVMPSVTFVLSDEELCDFAYCLFFVGLIDLDIEDEPDLNYNISKLFLGDVGEDE
jgi:hypothetical protein